MSWNDRHGRDDGAAADRRRQAVAAATYATYHARGDRLPAGVTSIPTLSGPDFLCAGPPS